MRFKVRGGTPIGGMETLCYTCRWSRVVRGRTQDEEIVQCDASHTVPMRVTFKVTSCSDYIDGRLPSYGELIQRAWILRPASKGRQAGFVRGSDLDYREMVDMMSDSDDRDC